MFKNTKISTSLIQNAASTDMQPYYKEAIPLSISIATIKKVIEALRPLVNGWFSSPKFVENPKNLTKILCTKFYEFPYTKIKYIERILHIKQLLDPFR